MAVDDVSPAEIHSCSDVCVVTQRLCVVGVASVGVVKRHYNVNDPKILSGVRIKLLVNFKLWCGEYNSVRHEQ